MWKLLSDLLAAFFVWSICTVAFFFALSVGNLAGDCLGYISALVAGMVVTVAIQDLRRRKY